MSIEDQVKDIIASKLMMSEELVDTNEKMENLGADSLDLVEIVMEVETQFNLNVPDERMEMFSTPNDIIDYVKQHT